jgi:hypothetical protein
MYLKKSMWTLLGYEKSTRKGKMYAAVLQNKTTRKIKRIHFGSSVIGNYSDKTGLNLYPHLIHSDKKRRKAFRSRFAHLIKPGYWSAAWFAYYILW